MNKVEQWGCAFFCVIHGARYSQHTVWLFWLWYIIPRAVLMLWALTKTLLWVVLETFYPFVFIWQYLFVNYFFWYHIVTSGVFNYMKIRDDLLLLSGFCVIYKQWCSLCNQLTQNYWNQHVIFFLYFFQPCFHWNALNQSVRWVIVWYFVKILVGPVPLWGLKIDTISLMPSPGLSYFPVQGQIGRSTCCRGAGGSEEER